MLHLSMKRNQNLLRIIIGQVHLRSNSFLFDKILPSKQCGFRKGYNVQHCLIALIEKWKKNDDNSGASVLC